MRKTLALFVLLGAGLAACAAPATAPVEAPPGEQAAEPSQPPPAPPEPATPPSAPAAGTPDYACQQASDCAIKNVGNCCGYFPRCVNKDSVFEPVKCAEGTVGVCGYPTITRCECTAGRCESIQGDTAM